MVKRRRPPDVTRQIGIKLSDKLRIFAVFFISLPQLGNRNHQGLGSELTAIRAEPAIQIRKLTVIEVIAGINTPVSTVHL